MAEEPVIAGRAGIPLMVEEGKTYHWCACGRSKTQPFCDGSHAGTGIEPLAWVAPKSRTCYFCTCKHTGRAPLCDGSHNML